MGEVSELPAICSVCKQCRPIIADISARVRFRTLSGTFLSSMKICRQCAESLELSEEIMGDEERATCICGKDAAVMTSNGYRCRKCINK